VTIGTLVARRLGELAHPIRRTALHDWHAANGAVMMNAGLWKRPQYYAVPGASPQSAVDREVTTVRSRVGLVDVSTLGKIELCGRDAVTLLERLYVNGWRNLAVGRGRYGVMLRDDGTVFDDGVTRGTTRRARHLGRDKEDRAVGPRENSCGHAAKEQI
jgi:glycine cleavage system aminomethyltransferase T